SSFGGCEHCRRVSPHRCGTRGNAPFHRIRLTKYKKTGAARRLTPFPSADVTPAKKWPGKRDHCAAGPGRPGTHMKHGGKGNARPKPVPIKKAGPDRGRAG